MNCTSNDHDRPRLKASFHSSFIRLVVSALFAMLGSVAQAQSISTVAGENSGFGGLSDVHNDGSPAHSEYQDGLFYGTADAAAEYGVLHAYAHAKNLGNEKYSFATATAQFSDELTLAKGPNGPAGNTGYFTPTFTVDGSMQNDGAFPAAGVRYWSSDYGPFGDFNLTSGTHTYVGNAAIPFTYGVAFSFTAQLGVLVTSANGAFGEGVADFEHTARLTSYAVTDVDGNLVTDSTLTSASGTQYAAPVPEPSSTLTVAIGALVLLARKRSMPER